MLNPRRLEWFFYMTLLAGRQRLSRVLRAQEKGSSKVEPCMLTLGNPRRKHLALSA